MYPLTCAGGFNVPAKSGKFEIVGFNVSIDDPAADSYVAIIDGPGFIIGSIEPPTEQRGVLARVDADASATEGTLSWCPNEPVKTRYGTSLSFTNIKQGSFCLYVR